MVVLLLLLLVQRRVDRVVEGVKKARAGLTERKIVTLSTCVRGENVREAIK
jgi:hypothetical protein